MSTKIPSFLWLIFSLSSLRMNWWPKAHTVRYALPWTRLTYGSETMARKQTKGPSKMPATEERLRAVRLELSEQEHAALRIEAAKQDLSLMHMARRLVAEGLKRTRRGKSGEAES